MQGLWPYPRFPLSDQALYRRLGADGPAVLQALCVPLSAVLADRLTPYAARDLAPFATDVLALDHTTLDQVARLLPPRRDRPPGDPPLLPGQRAAAVDVRRQQVRCGPYYPDAQQNEKRGARAPVADLAPGTLVLADLGEFSFAWFDDLTDAGYWWLRRRRSKTSYQVAPVLDQQGQTRAALVWLGAHRADQAKHLVRLVPFRHGATLYPYVSNVTDPPVLRLGDRARLSARRWDSELAFLLLKRHLGLHLLGSATPRCAAWGQRSSFGPRPRGGRLRADALS